MSEGRAAAELSDAELEQQGTHAHATRNWVFLHGTAEQFAHHTERMLELEQEYLRRFPKRTWQGGSGAPREVDEATRLRLALRGLAAQISALLGPSEAEPVQGEPGSPRPDQVAALLQAVRAVGGRMHKLELHQVARGLGIGPVALAALYRGPQARLRTERDERVLVDGEPTSGSAGPLTWVQEVGPRWDADKQRLFATVPSGVFDLAHADGAELPGEWWAARDAEGSAVGYGWMDSAWGDCEVLLAVDASAQARGVGSFVLEHLEQEAVARGVNYVYNTVRETHPDRERLHDWLAVRGYRGSDRDEALRKRVTAGGDAAPVPAPAASTPAPPAAPGAEESGGYVDVEDHRY